MKLPESLKTIGQYAFCGCSALKKIELPGKLKSIGNNAFGGCENLTGVKVPGNVETVGACAFAGDENLTEIELEEGIKELGDRFIEETGISEVVVPKSVKTANYAFSNAEKLEKVTFAQGTEQIPAYVMCKYPWSGNEGSSVREVIMPEGVKVIGYGAFNNCDGLTEMKLPESLETIGEDAFYDCDGLTEMKLPESLETIGEDAFYDCDGLTEMKLPESLKTIGQYAFCGCSALKKIELPGKLKSIGNNAFGGCENLTGVKVPGNVETVGACAFAGDENLTEIELEEGIKELGDRFIEETGISEVVVPKSVKTANYAFSNAEKLEKVTFAQGTEQIPAYVMCKYPWSGNERSNVQEVYIPGSITEVGYSAFDNFAGNLYLATEDNMASIYAIDHEMMYTAKETGIADKKDGILARNKTYYNMGLSTPTTSGYVNLNIQYGIKQSISNISDMKLKIKLPSTAEIVSDTFKLDGKKYSVEQDENGYIYVPVKNMEGMVSFSVNILDVSYLMSYAQLEYYENGYKTETIGIVNMKKNIFTLTVPEDTSSASIDIVGFAQPGQSIDLYCEEEKIDTVVASKTGSYAKTVEISNPQKETIYKIQAKSSWNGEEYSAIAYTNYTDNAVELTQCTMYYRNQTYDLLQITGKRPVITWVNGNTFTFKVAFSDNSKVGEVEIVSTKNGEIKKLQAVWNEQQGAFVASGFEGYVPGNITIQYGEGLSTCLMDSQISIINAYDEENSHGYESEVTLKDGTMFYYLEEQEVNISEIPEDGFDRYDVEGITMYLSSENKYIEKGDKVYACQEYYELQDDGTYTLLRNGIGMKKTQTYTDNYMVAVTSDDALDYIGEVQALYEFLVTDISKNPENEKVYAWLYQAITTAQKSVELSSKEYLELQQLRTELELTELVGKTGPAFKQINHVIESAPKYGNNPEAFDKVMEQMSEEMSGVIDAMNDCAKNIENKQLSHIIKELTKKGCLGQNSLMERSMESMKKKAKTTKLSFNAKYSIDPSGYVYEAVTGNRVEGATVTIYYKDSKTGETILWDAEEYDQRNPLSTDKDGMYAWDVPEGLWQVKVEKQGYETVYSDWLPVPPPQLDINIGLTSNEKPIIESVEVYPDYTKIVFSKYMIPETMLGLKLSDASGKNISYALEYDTESVDLAGVNYAKEYILRYKEGTLEPDESCVLTYDKNIQSYAKVSMDTGEYKTKVTRHTEIIAPDEITVKMGETLSIPIYVVNGNEETEILVNSSFKEIVQIQNTAVDEIKIYGNLCGNAEVVVSIAGTQIQKIIKVIVGKKAEEVKVKNKIVLPQEEYIMNIGETVEIVPSVYPDALAEGVWSAKENQEFITINGNKFTAKESGEVVLIYSLKEDATVFAECRIIIKNAADVSVVPGDVNGDGIFNMADAALVRRYVANLNVTIDTSAADVNRDGRIDMVDYALMRRALANWDVELT